MTTPTYDYVPGQYIKTTGTTSGDYKKELFEDKSQYFVTTDFTFYVPTMSADTNLQSLYVTNGAPSVETIDSDIEKEYDKNGYKHTDTDSTYNSENLYTNDYITKVY